MKAILKTMAQKLNIYDENYDMALQAMTFEDEVSEYFHLKELLEAH